MVDAQANIQKKIDGLIDKVFLRFIPYSVKPNHVTILRFILVPFVYWLLASGNFVWALILFIITASTDFIDGAMARTRNQITEIGKVIDPIADKLLIVSILLYIGFDYVIVKLFIFFIFMELAAILLGVIFSFAVGRPIAANIFGKIKMILQSFSVGFFILGIIIKSNQIIYLSETLLFMALAFAILASIEHIRVKILRLKKRLK